MREKTAKLLFRTKEIGRSAFVWNLVSACLNSFQTMLLLFVLTHWGSSADSGMLVMAYSAGNLMLNIGRFGMRQYQVTDAGEVFSFREYVRSRMCSLALMAAAIVLYLLWGAFGKNYSPEKLWVVGLLCVFKGIEAAEDVLHGRMQQQGRLDVAGKILTIRFVVYIAGFVACYLLTRNLVLTIAVNAGISLLLCVLLNGAVMPRFIPQAGEKEWAFRVPGRLLLQCLPLCLSMVMNIYLGNAPKYIIDGIVSDEAQTCFNIVFMPALVVALLSSFIFNPVLKKIGCLWVDGKIAELRKLVLKLTLIPVAIDAAVVAAGVLAGLPVLGFVYGVDVSAYMGELVVALLASGVMAMLNLYVALLTTMRKQPHILGAYTAGTVILVAFGRLVLKEKGLLPLCWMYLAVMSLVVIYCMIVYAVTIRKHS